LNRENYFNINFPEPHNKYGSAAPIHFFHWTKEKHTKLYVFKRQEKNHKKDGKRKIEIFMQSYPFLFFNEQERPERREKKGKNVFPFWPQHLCVCVCWCVKDECMTHRTPMIGGEIIDPYPYCCCCDINTLKKGGKKESKMHRLSI
jgi:hypothetical protein